MDLRLLSLNTRGFIQPFRDLLFYNLHFEADIFCSFADKWQGSCFWSPASGRQGSVITCLSDSFDFEVINWKRDTSGRIVW